jgi:hypothetical protein
LLPTDWHLATLDPHALVAVTHTGVAVVYGLGKLTVIELVPAPDVTVVPAGVVQLYPVAPATDGTENVTPVAPGHTFTGPDMFAGTAGLLLILIHLGALTDDPPHGSWAVTHNCPDVKPLGNNTDTFCVPCPELIAAGEPDNVQLYWVAPPDTPQL